MSLLRLRSIQQLRRRLLSNLSAEEEHARQTSVQWKWISILVGVPVCSYLFVKHVVLEDHSHSHKEQVEYDHMRIRKTQFPWGEESLFHSKPKEKGEEEVAVAVKEPIITAFLRKIQEDIKVRDDKIFKEFTTRCHQKMMEHIERKKFPEYPMLPTYTRMFGKKKIALGDPILVAPNSFDD